MWTLRVAVCCVALAGCLAHTAVAADRKPPCSADAERLCNLVPPTGSFVQGCLEQHRADLSEKCRARVGSYTSDTLKLQGDCQSDIARLCGPVKDRTGRLVPVQSVPGAELSCLLAHRDALSARCLSTLDDQSQE